MSDLKAKEYKQFEDIGKTYFDVQNYRQEGTDSLKTKIDENLKSDTKNNLNFIMGLVFPRTWNVICKKPVVIFGFVLLYYIITIYRDKAIFPIVQIDTGILHWRLIAVGVILTVIYVIFQGMITCIVFMFLKNGRATISESFQLFINRGSSVVKACIATILATILLLIVLFISIIERFKSLPFFIINLVFYYLVFRLLTSWILIIQVCIIEQTGTLNSFYRSSKLTEGYRLRIFGIITIFLITSWCLRFLFNLVNTSGQMYIIPLTLIMIIIMAFVNVMFTVVYYSLREIKGDLTKDSIAE